jgi:hypothetical protein
VPSRGAEFTIAPAATALVFLEGAAGDADRSDRPWAGAPGSGVRVDGYFMDARREVEP